MNFNKFLYAVALIVFTLVCLFTWINRSHAGEKSEWLNDNPCMIKVIITNTEVNGVTTTTKQEKLECKDGYDGPNYWELFAQFYYHDVNTPEYCRYYSRNKHAFKSPGKVCLDVNGEWEVR